MTGDDIDNASDGVSNEMTPLKKTVTHTQAPAIAEDYLVSDGGCSIHRHKRIFTVFVAACILAVTIVFRRGTAVGGFIKTSNMEVPMLGQAMLSTTSNSGWSTAWTSEEEDEEPVNCGNNPANGMSCKGLFCDWVRLHCEPKPESWGDVVETPLWVGFVSEETNALYCNPGSYVTGLKCTGTFCDNLSVKCTKFSDHQPSECYWSTGTFSSTERVAIRSGGYFIQGMKCSGWWCKTKQLYWCK